MSKGGRPSKYTPELAEAICNRIAMGEGLAEILRSMKDGPSYPTVMGWLFGPAKIGEFSENYARAREAQAEWDADHIRSIARDLEQCRDRDTAEAKYKAAQLFQWNAGKRKPKAFGDKIQTEHSGEVKVVEQRMVLEQPPPGWKAGPDGG